MEDGTPVAGFALSGSANVRVNGLPALRVGDEGVVMTPEGPRIWRAALGARRIAINGEPLHRCHELGVFRGGVGRLRGGEFELPPRKREVP